MSIHDFRTWMKTENGHNIAECHTLAELRLHLLRLEDRTTVNMTTTVTPCNSVDRYQAAGVAVQIILVHLSSSWRCFISNAIGKQHFVTGIYNLTISYRFRLYFSRPKARNWSIFKEYIKTRAFFCYKGVSCWSQFGSCVSQHGSCNLWSRVSCMMLVLDIYDLRTLTLILPRSRTGTVWFYTSTSNKRAARPKLYTKPLTRDLKLMYSRLTLVRISINL